MGWSFKLGFKIAFDLLSSVDADGPIKTITSPWADVRDRSPSYVIVEESVEALKKVGIPVLILWT